MEVYRRSKKLLGFSIQHEHLISASDQQNDRKNCVIKTRTNIPSSFTDTMATSSKHVFSLVNHTPYFESENGNMKKVTADELPILKNMSIKRMELGPKAIREPHCTCWTCFSSYK
jgi:hypothetical protein